MVRPSYGYFERFAGATRSLRGRRSWRPVCAGGLAVVNDFRLFELHTDALQFAHFVRVVEDNPVGMNLRFGDETIVQIANEFVLTNIVGLVDVKNEFIDLQRVIVAFSQFQLPGADVLGVIEDVLELIEIHQRPFDFVEPHFFDLRTAGDVADQARRSPATTRAGFIYQAAVNEISGAITQHYCAPGVEWSENQFAGLARWKDLAGSGVHQLEQAQVGREMIARGVVAPAGAF